MHYALVGVLVAKGSGEREYDDDASFMSQY